MKIGDTIKRFRKSNGIKQKVFAKQIGIAPNSLRAIENGKVRPTPKTMERICREMNLSEVILLLLSISEADLNDRTLYLLTLKPLQDYLEEKLPLR